ncbi:Tox-REase-5 domain-containing protein [Xanthomonas translucens]|uniref:Tox-REase-5 domain-containing protein n=1 Tax=Xanthomonas campestris pv. translucens TaxID=343 RepID=UPI00071E9878|nr:Tox-REase-5 domain-containing protein [Xanthomonas translucens]QEO25553.1 hypothetical protein F0H32_04485 [Xanthomonas translucens pv. undulosa]WLA01568.1 restriction endonuclease fold toxin 5 domain-containing protein [Xanthomonas translucens]WLA08432.1 restriction endonuclease fold toxin 5 domain-containing protein [Xanthomonas translucens]
MVAIPIRWGLKELAERAAAAIAAAAAANAAKDAIKPDVKAREADCSQTPDATQCNQCKLINGRVGQPPTPRYITSRNRINYDYQLQIANMFAGPERFGYVEWGDNTDTIVNIELNAIKEFFGGGGKYVTLEWLFGRKSFDGFWRSRCTVVEAKANFSSFFDDDGDEAKPFTGAVVNSWVTTYFDQEKAIAPTKPQGKLEWHFMDGVACKAAIGAGIPVSVARTTPYILGRL